MIDELELNLSESNFFWYRTHQDVKADKWAYIKGILYVGFHSKRSYKEIDRLNLTEIGFGTLSTIDRSIENET